VDTTDLNGIERAARAIQTPADLHATLREMRIATAIIEERAALMIEEQQPYGMADAVYATRKEVLQRLRAQIGNAWGALDDAVALARGAKMAHAEAEKGSAVARDLWMRDIVHLDLVNEKSMRVQLECHHRFIETRDIDTLRVKGSFESGIVGYACPACALGHSASVPTPTYLMSQWRRMSLECGWGWMAAGALAAG